MKHWIGVTVAGSIMASAATVARAQTNKPNWVDASRVERALDRLNRRYGDVRSALNCPKPRSTAESLICKSDYLRRAELLNTRAAAAAYENATKTLTDHKAFRGKIPHECPNGQCIYEFFANETNASRGGSSPYYDRNPDRDGLGGWSVFRVERGKRENPACLTTTVCA